MASPVIRSVTPSATTVEPGGQFTVTVDAYDPDARTLTFTASTTDTQGGTATATTIVVVGDPLTFELACDDASVTVTQDPQAPGVFVVTA